MAPTWSRDSTRRFTDRPFYTQREIEEAAQTALRQCAEKAKVSSTWPLPDHMLHKLVDFLTLRFDPYGDLSHIGIDVDGYTVFSRVEKPSVFINRDLDDPRYRLRRRMTIAHELGHVVLHQKLYERDDRQLDLLVPEPLTPVYCAKNQIVRSVDWCEWQAGFFGGALLMPTNLLVEYIGKFDEKALIGVAAEGFSARRLEVLVSEEFDVSKEAARVRLSQVGIIKPAPQARLDEQTA